MECRNFQLTLISANALEDVRKIFRMKVYARVSIGGNPKTEKQSPADKHNKTNPSWNYSVKYTVGEDAIRHHGVMVVIKLYCKRKFGDRYIGEVVSSVKWLFDHAYPYGGSAMLSFPVKRGSENSQGVLSFSYRFGERVTIKRPPRWKKLLKSGAVILWRITELVSSTVGIIDISIPIFVDPVIVDAT